MYTLDIYRLDVTTGNFSRIDSITTYKNLTFWNKLDGIGGCRFDMTLQDPKTTSSNFKRYINQVAVRRNNTVVFFGPITDFNGNYKDVTGNVTVDCQSYLFHLSSRFTDKLKHYPSQDISAIAVDLINTTQGRLNGDLGINIGSTPTAISRDRTYEYKQIDQALTDLSDLVGGIDFSFDIVQNYLGVVSAINFNTYPDRLMADRRDIAPFVIGQNVKAMGFRTIRPISNNSIVEGAGTGEEVYVSNIDYGVSQQAYTRRESVNSLKDAALASTVEYYNTALIEQTSVEQFMIDLTMYQNRVPTFDDINLGNIIYLNSNIGGTAGLFYFTNKQARILEINVAVDAQAAETITTRVQMLN